MTLLPWGFVLPGYDTIPLDVIELEGPKETLLLTAPYQKWKVCNKVLRSNKGEKIQKNCQECDKDNIYPECEVASARVIK